MVFVVYLIRGNEGGKWKEEDVIDQHNSSIVGKRKALRGNRLSVDEIHQHNDQQQ